MLKNEIIGRIIDLEGGYVNDPRDSGGETNFGITKKVAITNGYKGDMKKMPYSVAFKIYSKKYWDPMSLDKIQLWSPSIAEELADTAVNMGVTRASKFLQRSLNALNNIQKNYPDLKLDGILGGNTVKSLKKFLFTRGSEGEKVILKMLNCLQGEFYVSLAERREKDERFIFGWFKNRISDLK